MRNVRLLTATVALVAFTSTPAMAADRQTPQAAVNQVRGDARPDEAGVHERPCQPLEFCTYHYADYSGIVDRISSCVLHLSHGPFRSYINRQTRGTRARLYDRYLNFQSYTKPAPDRGTTSLGADTWFIRPC
jgi:hypothetical protein